MIQRALQLEHEPLQSLLARLAFDFGKLRSGDLGSPRHVQLAPRRERKQSADIIECEQCQPAGLLLEEMCDIALSHFGDIDRFERESGALKQLHALTNAIVARRNSIDVLCARGA